MVDSKIRAAGLNFEKEGPFRMAVGVTTCLRGCGCSTFPHTPARSLTSPSQAKPSQAKAGMAWHGLGGCGCALPSTSGRRPKYTPTLAMRFAGAFFTCQPAPSLLRTLFLSHVPLSGCNSLVRVKQGQSTKAPPADELTSIRLYPHAHPPKSPALCPFAPPPPGTCFNFHSGRGGGSPPDPLPPSPLSSSAPENLGFGNIF